MPQARKNLNECTIEKKEKTFPFKINDILCTWALQNNWLKIVKGFLIQDLYTEIIYLHTLVIKIECEGFYDIIYSNIKMCPIQKTKFYKRHSLSPQNIN